PDGRPEQEAFLADIWTIPAEKAKNGMETDVPLSNAVKRILKKLKPITGKSKWVFESPRLKGKPLSSVKKTTEKIQEATSVSDFRLHDLRRTLITHMEEILIDDKVIKKVVNHAAEGVTGKQYQWYNYNDKKLEALTRWSWRVQSIISSEKPKVKLHKVG
ncbi:MAG TPA: hypothetical protein DD671_03800, partial [Balneolaceae bacterium]|nr:hypothetical protein [Balneolaceae bacterium]